MEVLFICKFNVGRSQMAEALFNKFARRSHAISAGVNPYYLHQKTVHALSVTRAMADIGMDFTKKRIKMVNREMVRKSDLVVALMSRERARKDLSGYVKNSPKFRLWDIEDVNGSRSEDSQYKSQVVRREMIKRRVLKLLEEIER